MSGLFWTLLAPLWICVYIGLNPLVLQPASHINILNSSMGPTLVACCCLYWSKWVSGAADIAAVAAVGLTLSTSCHINVSQCTPADK